MKIPRELTSCFLLCGALASAALAADPIAARASAPTLIFVVRNAEQVAGSGEVLPLTEAGRARAEALAALLEPAGVSAIFSSQMSWTQETVAPLAARQKLQPVIIPFEETDRLAAELEKLPPGAVALVANQGGKIPALIEKLTGRKMGPVKGHDRVWVISRQAGGAATVAELRYGSGS